jgi:hypothetical protein
MIKKTMITIENKTATCKTVKRNALIRSPRSSEFDMGEIWRHTESATAARSDI